MTTRKQGTTTAAFRTGTLEPALIARQHHDEGLGLVAQRMVERYAALLRRELDTITLTEREAALICDALNGVWLRDGDSGIMLAWAEVADHIALNKADADHGLTPGEADDLVARLRDMTPGQRHALVDAVERFWRDPNRLPTYDLVRDVGLVRGEVT